MKRCAMKACPWPAVKDELCGPHWVERHDWRVFMRRDPIGEPRQKKDEARIFAAEGLPGTRAGHPRLLAPASIESLSEREREIAALVVQGLKNKDIAAKIYLSQHTVKNHLRNIFHKLGISGRLALAVFATDTKPAERPPEDEQVYEQVAA